MRDRNVIEVRVKSAVCFVSVDIRADEFQVRISLFPPRDKFFQTGKLKLTVHARIVTITDLHYHLINRVLFLVLANFCEIIFYLPFGVSLFRHFIVIFYPSRIEQFCVCLFQRNIHKYLVPIA